VKHHQLHGLGLRDGLDKSERIQEEHRALYKVVEKEEEEEGGRGGESWRKCGGEGEGRDVRRGH